ncbi:pilus assembly protein N-terminal domain-containing protein [Fulvimarina sp. 2208YS6-2-32]|uniref:Pilus assembly protein N-terminal domain-containing protein n=1 Tax=Fulvimarina uroteuthidis TaxID=3098149 RepID=A0ABU5HZE7_9HYPH|nr:pilus assembly protein N-terminal domain-containing protein [Fulvimarina sp. 2208YS6-2-32]MDY8108457.1 pilus assembly protein N-terminal domain-containing protein [Fulvimarina sp. 2208YS6-2-32]
MTSRLFRTALAAAVAIVCWLAVFHAPARAEAVIAVAVDHARILEIDRGAGTVIIGNPAIVDVEVLSETRLVLTGKSYGITNVVVLGRDNAVLMDEQVAVQTFEANTVRIYRQALRQTYACAPKCEPTVTIGDTMEVFSTASNQYETRRGIAETAASK